MGTLGGIRSDTIGEGFFLAAARPATCAGESMCCMRESRAFKRQGQKGCMHHG